MTQKKRVHVTSETLRTFARGEISFADMIEIEPLDQSLPEVTYDTYRMTLDDFDAALKHFSKEESREDLLEWEAVITTEHEPACQALQVFDTIRRSTCDKKGYPCLPVSDEDVILMIVSGIIEDENEDDDDEDGQISKDILMSALGVSEDEYAGLMAGLEYDDERLEEYRELISDVRKNRSKKEDQWEFPEQVKDDFIERIQDWFEDGGSVPAHLVSLYITYVEDLAETEDVDALEALAYGYAGGNQAFPCDWKQANGYFEELLRVTRNPEYGVQLGKIAASGCLKKNQKPDYEQAFRYYTAAALNGSIEGRLCLADMYNSGEYVKEDVATCFTILDQLIRDSQKAFLDGSPDSLLPEVATRLALLFEQMAVNEDDTDSYEYLAMHYLLQAAYAERQRRMLGESDPCEGTEETINDALQRLGSHVKVSAGMKHFRCSYPGYLQDMLTYGLLEMRVSDVSGGRLELQFSRPKEEYSRRDLLVIMPDLCYCSEQHMLKIQCSPATSKVKEGQIFIINSIEPANGSDSGVVFNSFGRKVLQITDPGFKCEMNPNGFFAKPRAYKTESSGKKKK
ncbi:MAG: hypothetical protein LKF79_08135 [Solobacterium sp.]|nr:hypothetical protein [Solobacterium sp.]MCH4221778.1 hypothetical protein [Solobacterium sp.]MCH4266595.1 hypothetical protein [Solobacterium sp.]